MSSEWWVSAVVTVDHLHWCIFLLAWHAGLVQHWWKRTANSSDWVDKLFCNWEFALAHSAIVPFVSVAVSTEIKGITFRETYIHSTGEKMHPENIQQLERWPFFAMVTISHSKKYLAISEQQKWCKNTNYSPLSLQITFYSFSFLSLSTLIWHLFTCISPICVCQHTLTARCFTICLKWKQRLFYKQQVSVEGILRIWKSRSLLRCHYYCAISPMGKKKSPNPETFPLLANQMPVIICPEFFF